MRRLARWIAGIVGAAVVGASAALAAPTFTPALAATAPAGETVEIKLLHINDFHGRVDGLLTEDKEALAESATVQFAATVEQLKAAHEHSVLLSAGDNVGASLFASAIQDDVPTIEILNALGLAASAIGNHEFDRGWADAQRIQSLFDAPLLGANVYQEGTETPVLPEYAVIDVGGVRLAVVGAVVEETPSLVDPALIEGIEFGNPVEAVNRVVAQLVAGDLADVIVAEYHEAAPPEDEGQDAAEVYLEIIEETAPEVSAIFTGHSHQRYLWDAPIPGTDRTRPILQTGAYGNLIGQVLLQVDTATGEVASYTAELVPVPRDAPLPDLIESSPVVAEVAEIVFDALVRADVEGGATVTEVTAPITRAFAAGEWIDGEYERTAAAEEDRGEASALGTLVANALAEAMKHLPSPPDFGIVNPGGLRADLVPGVDGEITVADARAVLPFNNELSVAEMTGAQVVTMLEQQWQRDRHGNPLEPSYLQLGLSSNVEYTFSELEDPAFSDGRVKGVVHSVSIDGEPLELAETYRVGTYSFLTNGGDNFWVFQDADVTNTGLLDWQSWLDYLAEESPISPSFKRAGVQVDGLSEDSLVAGQSHSVRVARVDVPSVGAPQNTTVTAILGDVELATAELVGGVAELDVVVPADAPLGGGTVSITVEPTGTEVSVPVHIVHFEPVEEGAMSGIDFAGIGLLALVLLGIGVVALIVRRVDTGEH